MLVGDKMGDREVEIGGLGLLESGDSRFHGAQIYRYAMALLTWTRI